MSAVTSAPVQLTLQDVRRRGRVRTTVALFGPAFVASVAYVDPGNFATNFAGGEEHMAETEVDERGPRGDCQYERAIAWLRRCQEGRLVGRTNWPVIGHHGWSSSMERTSARP